jgi:hypothetical protein
VDEALALIVSYEALLRYPDSPFSAQSLSAVTKLRAALPPDVVAELDRLRRHVAVVEPVREYEASLLGELLRASLDEAPPQGRLRLHQVRGVRAGRLLLRPGRLPGVLVLRLLRPQKRSERVFEGGPLPLRRAGGRIGAPAPRRPRKLDPRGWERGGERLKLQAYVTERGTKSFELVSLFGRIEADGEADRRRSWMAEAEIPRSEIEFYASRLLSVGTDVKVE